MDEPIDWAELVRRRKAHGPRLIGELKEWGEGKPDEYEWDRGIVLDTLFDGLEDEIKRVNTKLGLK